MKKAISACAAVLLAVLLLPGCSGIAGVTGRQPLPPKPTPTAAPAPAGGMPAGDRIVAEGRVSPARNALLSFPMGGILAKVSVGVGDRVEAGQALAALDMRQLDLALAQADANLAATRAKLDQAARPPSDQDVAAAQQNLSAAQALYDKLHAGPAASEVAAAQAALTAAQQNYGRVRAGASADQLAQLKALLDNAKATVDQAQAAYDRAGGASRPDIGAQPQSLQLQQATNNYTAALAAYNEARAHPTAAELAAAASQVQAAQAGLDRLTPDAAQIQQAAAAVENAKLQLAKLQPSESDRAVLQANVDAARAARDVAAGQLSNARLLAPFAGAVMTLDIDPGEYAAPGQVVLRLADTSAWQVETTDLTELNVARVSEGLPVTMTFDAVEGLELPGRVTRIQPYGESKQGDIVYTVVITPDRQDDRLRWNMTAKVSIEAK